MKQKVLLLIVLALGMCGTAGFAQEKEYKVGDDGFEWYKTTKKDEHGYEKHGAEDRNGKTIIPTEYYDIYYYPLKDGVSMGGFLANMKDIGHAWYNKNGKCIIPYSRGYDMIYKWDSGEFGTYYQFDKRDGGGVCDRNGREVVFIKGEGVTCVIPGSETINEKEYYYFKFVIRKNGESYWGVADSNGKIIVPAEHKDSGTARDLGKSRLTTTMNPLAGNRHETQEESEGRPSGGQSSTVAGQQQQQGQNTTVVVEHHHDPVPVQQWQACFACGGMGTMGCDNCGGGGTKYIGDRLHRCSRCNGRGIIPCNVCYGSKGQYITVYR